jgi:hypothetical protein
MAWDCINSCNIITTNIARQIITANSPLTSALVEHTNPDGTKFNLADPTCLRIVIDLKDEGGLVLQKIGILIDNLQQIRNETFDPTALAQLRCAALCPSPFSIQLSETVGISACAACENCTQPDNSARYLMMIAFFLGLMLLLYFLSLLCYFWRQWSCTPLSNCHFFGHPRQGGSAPQTEAPSVSSRS